MSMSRIVSPVRPCPPPVTHRHTTSRTKQKPRQSAVLLAPCRTYDVRRGYQEFPAPKVPARGVRALRILITAGAESPWASQTTIGVLRDPARRTPADHTADRPVEHRCAHPPHERARSAHPHHRHRGTDRHWRLPARRAAGVNPAAALKRTGRIAKRRSDEAARVLLDSENLCGVHRRGTACGNEAGEQR